MSAKRFRLGWWALVTILLILSEACGPRPRALPTTGAIPPAATDPMATDLPATSTATPAASPVPQPTHAQPTATLFPTLTPPVVMITAVTGDLAIRQGPDISFDAVARLKKGQSVQAVARSVQDGWLEVPIPSQLGKMGWIFTRTDFSSVQGDVLDLPLILTVEWPTGAYLLNCTAHEVIVRPGDVHVPPIDQTPANRVWFYPGLYSVYDADVPGNPLITQAKLWPHTEINLIKDGNGTKYTCP